MRMNTGSTGGEIRLAWEPDKKTLTKRLLKDIDGEFNYGRRAKEAAIDEAIGAMIFDSGLHSQNHRGIPGEIIQHLPKKTRDILQHCTSQDWMHRLPEWLDNDKSLDAIVRRMAPNWKKRK
jgi:hypothetical protein